MKLIIVEWMEEDTPGVIKYGVAMYVVYSTHKRFTVGSRFDFGFLELASREGYMIQILPKDN